MGFLAEYLTSVTGAAIVIGGVCCLPEKNSSAYKVIRLICGIFMTIVMIQPILQLNIRIPLSELETYKDDAASITQQALQLAAEEQKQIIMKQTREYIQSKLDSLHIHLDFKITLEEESPFAPQHIQLSGSISPYTKKHLSTWLTDNLGIKAEEQSWTG